MQNTKRGLTGVVDGTYWQKWGQLPDVKEAHRQKAKAAYRALSPDDRRARRAIRVAARQAKLASDPVFAAAQAEKNRARYNKWRATHPTLANRRVAASVAKRPEVKRANKLARRTRGKIAAQFVKFLREQACIDCGFYVPGQMTVAHLIPIRQGGTNHPCNLATQCMDCNKRQDRGHGIHPRWYVTHHPLEAAKYEHVYAASIAA